VGPEGDLDRLTNTPAFSFQGSGPLGGQEVSVEAFQDDVQIVQATEPGLKAAGARGEGPKASPFEPNPDLGEVPKPTDLDAKSVESRGARPPARFAMGRPNPVVAAGLFLLQHVVEQRVRAPARGQLEALL
jgi:hypothetical protein